MVAVFRSLFYKFSDMCMCDYKQIGKFMYNIIMSEVKVSNVIARKPVVPEISDTADSTHVR